MKYTFFEYDASGEEYDKDAGYDSNCKIRFAIQLNGETVYTGEYDYIAHRQK
jgi:hypothetical protein